MFPSFFFPPSYTHRPSVEFPRARGPSRAHGRVPPLQFVWGFLKIGPSHINRPSGPHACSPYLRVPAVLLEAGRGVLEVVKGPWSEWEGSRNLQAYPTPPTLHRLPYTAYPTPAGCLPYAYICRPTLYLMPAYHILRPNHSYTSTMYHGLEYINTYPILDTYLIPYCEPS